MLHPPDKPTAFTLVVQVEPRDRGPNPYQRLRAFAKLALRVFGLKITSIKPMDQAGSGHSRVDAKA